MNSRHRSHVQKTLAVLCLAGSALASATIGSGAVAEARSVPRVAGLAAFPVAGNCNYTDTWGAPRSGGRRHEGVDVIANEGTPLVAVVDGTITKIVRDYPGSLGGNYFRLSHSDGTYFTYIHLSAFASGLSVGSRVRTGQVLGYVGKTGATSVAHLHFEVHPFGGSAVNPTPFVTAAGGCQNKPGTPPPPPTGGITKMFSPAAVVYNSSALVWGRTPTSVQIVGFPGISSTSSVASITVALTATGNGRAAVWPCGTNAGLTGGTPLTPTRAWSVTTSTVTIRPGDRGRVCVEAESPVLIKIAVNGVG